MFARFAFDLNCPNCSPPRDNTIILPEPSLYIPPIVLQTSPKVYELPSFHISHLPFYPPQQSFELSHLSSTITHNHPTSLPHEQNGLNPRPPHLSTQHRHLQRQEEASPARAPSPEIPAALFPRVRRRPGRRHHRHWAQGHTDCRFA